MIHRGEREIRATHREAALAKHGECLRRGDLVDQV
jgi:hypothetical protein